MSQINKIAVIGAGNMGSGIAQKIAQEGLNVVMVDMREEFVDRGLNIIRNTLQEGLERKIFKPEQVAPATSAADEAVSFERLSFALASKVELDSQGRLLINERLRTRAGLTSQITLVGVRDHIEVWNSENWEQYITDHMTQYQNQMAQARKTVLQQQNQEI